MKEMLVILLTYSLIVIIDIYRIFRRLRNVNLTQNIRKTLMVHLFGALIIPSALTLLLTLTKNFDIKYLFLISLIGVWLTLFSIVTLFLDDVVEKNEQTF